MLIIKQIEESERELILKFLNRFEETSQFLITNMRDQGLRVTSHPSSGNYKAIYSGTTLIGVFCLTKRGNLLVQTSEEFSSEAVILDCQKENHEIRGFIGDWKSVEPLYKYYKAINLEYSPSYSSKELLYSLDLKRKDQEFLRDKSVRFLEEIDFEQWFPLSQNYRKELNVPNDISIADERKSFSIKIKNRVWWGLFDGNTLVSKMALNSRGDKIGQVGGVFTSKNCRQQGLAKRTMLHMLRDCIEFHKHERSILFAGEADIPAQKLYESIGYKRMGYFGLILG